MAVKIVDLKCSGCAAPLDPSMTFCPYCKKSVVVTSFNDIYAHDLPTLNQFSRALSKDLQDGATPELSGDIKFSLGACYLKLKLYDKAHQRFMEAIEEDFNNPEAPFYAAVSLLNGRKAYFAPLANIKRAMELVEAARIIEERGVFHLFLAYIKYDFYARKCLRISPDWKGELSVAIQENLTSTDVNILFDILGVECPFNFT